MYRYRQFVNAKFIYDMEALITHRRGCLLDLLSVLTVSMGNQTAYAHSLSDLTYRLSCFKKNLHT